MLRDAEQLSCLSGQKLFKTTVRSAIYTSKCTRNCLAGGLCPDPLGELI